jgi:hypothetical protein
MNLGAARVADDLQALGDACDDREADPQAGTVVSLDEVTLAARADEAGGPPFKVLRDLGQPHQKGGVGRWRDIHAAPSS